MSAKLLRAFGLISLLALAAGSFVALAIVRNRIDVTIRESDEAPGRGPTPQELLAADVAALQRDVGAIADDLRTSQDRIALELAALRRELAELGQRAEPQHIDPAAAAPPARNAPQVLAGSGGPEAPRKTFLAFQLPSRSFSFAGPQRLAIVPSLSRVGFDAVSTLHDFSGVTQAVSGELQVDLAEPGRGCAGAVEVDARSLDTGLAGRDADMRERLDVEHHPALRFEWLAFDAASIDASAMKLTGTARGRLSLKGRAREVAMPVRVAVDASRRVSIEGELALRMSDFGVQPPRQLGVISVEDEVRIWIALRARTLGPLEAAPRAAEDDRARK